MQFLHLQILNLHIYIILTSYICSSYISTPAQLTSGHLGFHLLIVHQHTCAAYSWTSRIQILHLHIFTCFTRTSQYLLSLLSLLSVLSVLCVLSLLSLSLISVFSPSLSLSLSPLSPSLLLSVSPSLLKPYKKPSHELTIEWCHCKLCQMGVCPTINPN